MRRVRHLDGLRGVAILMVFAAHVWNGIDPHGDRLISATHNKSGGGYLGVQLFFVLSGFLITSLLLRERERTGRISLRAFWARRARRLLPALFVVSGAYSAYALVALHAGDQRGAWGSVVRALTYTEDFPQLWTGLADNRWLSHSWTLAIEEQFYIVWPVLLILAIRWSRRAVVVVAAASIVADLVVQFTVPHPGDLPMHWDALMAGCLIASWPRPLRVPRVLGWLGLGALAAGLVQLPNKGPLVTTLSVVACALALLHAPRCGWLNNRFLVYFGMISYGLYLWHPTILRFGWPLYLTVPGSVAVADLSFRLVERRFLKRPPYGRASPGGGAEPTSQPLPVTPVAPVGV